MKPYKYQEIDSEEQEWKVATWILAIVFESLLIGDLIYYRVQDLDAKSLLVMTLMLFPLGLIVALGVTEGKLNN